ncbi:LD-carboxypeptidase [Promicromonospora thailandica]|uniref:Muramoyltetrapeptide carboxypeptidase n=1 Tax=Promicromonospora thailandica TaxID=765201 RepID=A0A9X2JUZ9_9MICO|nr:LD-carboxypeptidase [Promicromonospora thailandica]MCP2264541.1 muramoyltetrapeptide carboxypeptidase [Promicromonospora thailandica]BFF20394.1 LD-carboxypeptidase [Promicromonospora thailandica]
MLRPLIGPPRLRPGDTVAVVAPSGPVPAERLDAGVRRLRDWDLEVQVMPHVRDTHPVHSYLAGSDAARAADFQEAWLDPDVRAVFVARGGYGASRMIDLTDWDALAATDPKVLVGYSDCTVLHQAVAQHLGVVSLHGPMPGTTSFLDSLVAREHLRRTLFEPEVTQAITGPGAHTLVGGTARGVTTGGCVSLLATSVGVGSPAPSAAGGIVLLEDVDEQAYRIDSFLTHLLRTGWFDGAVGVVLGSWQDCGAVEPVVLDLLGPLGIPVLGELGFGHGPDPLTVPLGVEARLDADAGTLTLGEPALGLR